MATNAKQYTDLSKVDSMEDTDLIAIARKGEQELVTTPAINVAQRAAEIVSSDQVQEVIADLGLGKQVLVQSLNNKGADVQASDTLVQMAAKVDGLDVLGAQELQEAVPAMPAYQNNPTSYNMTYCGKLDKFVQIDTTSGTVSIGTFNASGSFQPSISFTDDSVKSMGSTSNISVGISNNNSYLAIGILYSTAQKLVVYKINLEQNTTEHVYDYTYTGLSSIYGAPRGLYVTDDGQETFLFTSSTYNNRVAYYNNTTKKQLYNGNGISTSHIETSIDGYYDESTKTFYFSGIYASSNERYGLASSVVTITEDSIEFSTPSPIIPAPDDIYDGSGAKILKDIDVLVCYGKPSSGSDYYSINTIIKTFRFSTGELLDTYVCKAPYASKYTSAVHLALDMFIQKVGDTYYASTATGAYVSIDASGKIASVFGTKDIHGNNVGMYIVQNGTGQQYLGLLYNAGGSYIFLNDMIGGVNNFSYIQTSTYVRATKLLKKCIIGYWLKRNDNATLFLSNFSKSLYDAGAYDVENKVAVLNIQ